MSRDRKTYAFTFDPEIIGEIDRYRGYIPRSRYVEEILKEALKDGNRSKSY
jgi:hypothetical protein